MRNIVLIGFMGCGKTTVGRELARLLGRRFVDLDAFIEQRTGLGVSEIFARHGEAYFRALESQAAAELSAQREIVLSVGGGAVLRAENVDALRGGGRIVLIDVPLAVLRLRLAGDTTRPLLNRPDKDEAMRVLYELRMPLYRVCADDSVVNGDNRPAAAVAREIARRLGLPAAGSAFFDSLAE
jgi:shikimate kinase